MGKTSAKFKEGDKIRLIDNDGKRARRGATATVKDDTGYWTQIVWDRNELSGEQMDGGYCRADFELIANDNASPIRTVTRREIVPGKYGVVMIEESNAKSGTVLIDMWKANPTASELRSAARIFNEIADVLDEQKEAA